MFLRYHKRFFDTISVSSILGHSSEEVSHNLPVHRGFYNARSKNVPVPRVCAKKQCNQTKKRRHQITGISIYIYTANALASK